MAPAQPNNIPQYAAHLGSLHFELPAPRELTKMLRSLRSPRTRTLIRLPLHCRSCWEAPAQTCPVVLHQLPALNEWLYLLASEVREVAPGRLALFSLESDNTPRAIDDSHLQMAVVLLHCLLTRHRCLQAAEGLHVLLPCYRKIFCDALRNTSSLTSLHLSNCHLTGLVVRSLVAAITSTDLLEELALDSCKFPGGVRATENALAMYIRKTKALRALTIIYVPLFSDSTQLIESLEKNVSINKLALSVPVLLPEQGEAFRRFLANNNRILELELGSTVHDENVKVHKLFMGMIENSTLQKLSLCSFPLCLFASTWLSLAVAQSTTLLEVELPHCSWELRSLQDPEDPALQKEIGDLTAEMGRKWRVAPLVKALRATSSLRRLTLPACFHDWELRKLLIAAGKCASLERLTLDPLVPESLEAFHKALVDTGTTDKVSFRLCHVSPSQFVRALESHGDILRLTRHNFCGLRWQRFLEITSTLQRHDCITTLALRLDVLQGNINEEEASAIATYLSTTKVLKDIHMCFRASKKCAQTVIGGIAKNSTLEKLGIERWFVSKEDIDVLCKWLAASKTVYHLEYLCEDYAACKALVMGLEELLVDSYTLTYLRVKEFDDSTFQSLQAAKDFTRRNLSLVECAVHFVLGSTQKRAAEAFEKVSYHPEVAYYVEEATSLSPAAAKQKVREGSRRLRMQFWQLTGVVQDELVCERRSGGHMQIDRLGIDAWLHVRSFLRVTDVLDKATKKVRKTRKRKRRGW